MGRRVAIVGAGYAGMACAVKLADCGVPVTVYESGPIPGGRARRIVARGETLDNGQHILVGAYAELFGLMQRVGVPSEALLRMPLELRHANGFALRALWLSAPLGLLGGLLAARGLPMRERFGAVRFMLALRRAGFRAGANLTVEQLLRSHRQGRRIARFLWRPLCLSALNTPPERASAQAFLAVLRDTLGGAPGAADLLLPKVDLSRLFPEPAATWLAARGGELRLNARVRDLDAVRREHAAVVVAVGPHQLEALMPEFAPRHAYQPIYTCYLQYPEGVKLPLPMLGLDAGIVQWVFDRGALLGERGRLACVISAEGEHQGMSHEAIAAACARELAVALPGLPAPRWSRVIAEKRATVECAPGRARIGPETPWPDVLLAGDYTDPEYPPTLEAAARSGVRAAQLCYARLQ